MRALLLFAVGDAWLIMRAGGGFGVKAPKKKKAPKPRALDDKPAPKRHAPALDKWGVPVGGFDEDAPRAWADVLPAPAAAADAAARARAEAMIADGSALARCVDVDVGAHAGVRWLHVAPPILALDGFLGAAECDALVALAKRHEAGHDAAGDCVAIGSRTFCLLYTSPSPRDS